MKKLAYSLIALAMAAPFVACDDDNDDNPTLVKATEFVLNTPSYVNELVDLSMTDSLSVTWSQPNWGFPLVASYTVEVSPSGSFTVSSTDTLATAPADFYELDVTSKCSKNIAGKEIDRALAAILGWESEADVLAEQDVYLRVKAIPSATTALTDQTIYSNVVKLTTRPYYIALVDADPEMWYLIGSCIGDGGWTNTPESLGTSTFPMSIIADAAYDSNTGKGKLKFTGYLTTSGFKVIRELGSWNDQWGMSDGEFVYQDGGSSNITVEADGYYVLTVDNANNEVSLEPYDGAPTVHEGISLSGDFNSWTDTEMTAFSVTDDMAGHNHLWVATLEVPAGGTTLKFKTTGSWDTNWGGTGFPYGIGVGGGSDIPVGEGTWIICLNDIDGSYAFFQN